MTEKLRKLTLGVPMDELSTELMLRLAAKYIWWKSPEEAIRTPKKIAAQIMNLGDYEDVQALVNAMGDEYLVHVLQRAEAGQFNDRSWAYWHYRLGASRPGQVPALPERRIA